MDREAILNLAAHADHDVVILLQNDAIGRETVYLECETCDSNILRGVV